MEIQDSLELSSLNDYNCLFAIIYFSEQGFEPFASNINDPKLLLLLQNYPTLLGMMQNQNPEGLATTKISKDLFLFAYVLTLKNPLAKDLRLRNHTTTVINFLINRKDYLKLMYYFDEFEKYLEEYFSPITFLDDLYAIDFPKIISLFLSTKTLPSTTKKEEEIEESLATEFKRWLKKVEFEGR